MITETLPLKGGCMPLQFGKINEMNVSLIEKLIVNGSH